ncbi:hypothetical protein CYMTET_50295 [Cymbomonas tetramitiformis]|uniref:Uncharacterized protein n=1 Tax=Cymbomonas tetramitiformis TaxID=36881 RepID=A0AAE0BPQ1_9CHLO|nr:hypothetical protein CYMTET_50295 [Cymbomonas tetramitiformis]
MSNRSHFVSGRKLVVSATLAASLMLGAVWFFALEENVDKVSVQHETLSRRHLLANHRLAIHLTGLVAAYRGHHPERWQEMTISTCLQLKTFELECGRARPGSRLAEFGALFEPGSRLAEVGALFELRGRASGQALRWRRLVALPERVRKTVLPRSLSTPIFIGFQFGSPVGVFPQGYQPNRVYDTHDFPPTTT